MKIIEGDLLKLFKSKHFNIIIHGCNCQNNMSAGIAQQIKQQFPDAYKADIDDTRKPKQKLGSFSAHIYIDQTMIINAYTQLSYGYGIQVNYTAMKKSFEEIAESLTTIRDNKMFDNDFKIGYPMIGAGLGGGDWKKIEPLLDNAFKSFDHTLVKYNEQKGKFGWNKK